MTPRTKRWIFAIAGIIVVGAAALPLLGRWYFKRMSAPEYWADDVAAFEIADRDRPPPERPVVFVGSSSISLWRTLQADMAPLPVLNRGFGGAQLSQVVHYVDQTVIRYRPRAVVLYAGDNDLDARLHTGKTPADVANEFKSFVAQVEAALPDTRIYYVSMKPSRERWADWPQEESGNTLIAAICASDRRLAYLDIATPMLAAGAPPPDDLFTSDGMHASAKGYALWTHVIKPRLMSDFSTASP